MRSLIANLARPDRTGRRDWYQIANADATASDTAEVFIYDVIGDFWDMGVPASQFVQELRGIKAANILLRVNSPGGIIDDAVAMRNALLLHPANKVTRIEGIGASCASWVGLGDWRMEMAPHSKLMIHDPWGFCGGDSSAFRKEADALDLYADDIATMYVEKAGGEPAAWRDLMRAETWYTAQGAVDAGLAAAISGSAQAENRYDPSFLQLFKNVPAELMKRRTDVRQNTGPLCSSITLTDLLSTINRVA